MMYKAGDFVKIKSVDGLWDEAMLVAEMFKWAGTIMHIKETFGNGYKMFDDREEQNGNGWTWYDGMIERKVDLEPDPNYEKEFWGVDSIEPSKPYSLPDSGQRREFGTGAVRDMGSKGRCDLLPWDVLADLPPFEHEDVRRFCWSMEVATRDRSTTAIRNALMDFINLTYGGDVNEAMLQVAHLYEAGARKYSERNWQKGIPVEVYLDSAGRHFLKYMRKDKDEPHDRAVIWNLLGALWTIKHLPDMAEGYREEE